MFLCWHTFRRAPSAVKGTNSSEWQEKTPLFLFFFAPVIADFCTTVIQKLILGCCSLECVTPHEPIKTFFCLFYFTSTLPSYPPFFPF